ncbi:transmembrane protein 234-like protein [Senna tora]|uniref:Transmembrane protein 234-like protein n=1 Tax=Senna tora TaxID=362788 RepID=A0A834WC94_9FABA|nr:transmembrane protein 234-like protein [Senna tora]
MVRDIEKMIAVGLVWGATNAIMRRGALLWDQALKSSSSSKPPQHSTLPQRIVFSLRNWLKLLSIWQYTVPFVINLLASATFFAILSDAPISLAVPVTNATTFAATAVFGMLLGENTHVGRALLGTAVIVSGVWLCIKS